MRRHQRRRCLNSPLAVITVKRTTRICASTVLCELLLSYASPVVASSLDGGWENVNSVTRRRDYDFVTRDGRCVSGPIVAVDSSTVTITVRPTFSSKGSANAVLHAADLLRITDGGSVVHNAIFSGRSSWTDIGQAGPRGPRERVVVITSDGRVHVGESVSMSEDSLLLSQAQHREIERKSEIRRVLYRRVKPLSAAAEYMAHENVLIDPELWWDGLFLGTIPVLLYDASEPEDNSEVQCMNH
jgi:hypothetical protein